MKKCDACKVNLKSYDVSDESKFWKTMVSCPKCHTVYRLIPNDKTTVIGYLKLKR
jgi:ssDNA-binding Zn-finger/Zn-ribbon topoisomerase 1